MLGNVYFRIVYRLLPWAALLLAGRQSLPPALPANTIIAWAHHGNGTVLAFGRDDLLASGGSAVVRLLPGGRALTTTPDAGRIRDFREAL